MKYFILFCFLIWLIAVLYPNLLDNQEPSELEIFCNKLLLFHKQNPGFLNYRLACE